MAMEDGRGRREVRFEAEEAWAVEVRRGSRDDIAMGGWYGAVWDGGVVCSEATLRACVS